MLSVGSGGGLDPTAAGGGARRRDHGVPPVGADVHHRVGHADQGRAGDAGQEHDQPGHTCKSSTTQTNNRTLHGALPSTPNKQPEPSHPPERKSPFSTVFEILSSISFVLTNHYDGVSF